MSRSEWVSCAVAMMDVDGTLEEQDLVVRKMKVFDAHGGQGLSLAQTIGIKTVFITSHSSPEVSKRATELKVDFVYLGQARKFAAFEAATGRRLGQRLMHGPRPHRARRVTRQSPEPPEDNPKTSQRNSSDLS